ncbi:MAG: hypothetical protein H0X17_13945 [Deltaproteobacteria bacterium]|nr:hypothetical protein [Deltaproteobacteria bacterium]
MSMLIGLGILLLVLWIALKLVWGVASMGVHLLLAVGVIVMIAHFARGFLGSRGGGKTV